MMGELTEDREPGKPLGVGGWTSASISVWAGGEAISRFKEVRMWERQQPQQFPKEREGLEVTGPLRGQSYPGGDRQ